MGDIHYFEFFISLNNLFLVWYLYSLRILENIVFEIEVDQYRTRQNCGCSTFSVPEIDISRVIGFFLIIKFWDILQSIIKDIVLMELLNFFVSFM